MTKDTKDMLMLQLLPSIVKRETSPTEAVWYAHQIITELERRKYFEVNYSTPLEYPTI